MSTTFLVMSFLLLVVMLPTSHASKMTAPFRSRVMFGNVVNLPVSGSYSLKQVNRVIEVTRKIFKA